MFINIGGKFIRTKDIKVIDATAKALGTYSGEVLSVGVEIEALVKQINETEKDSSGRAMSAEQIKPLAD